MGRARPGPDRSVGAPLLGLVLAALLAAVLLPAAAAAPATAAPAETPGQLQAVKARLDRMALERGAPTGVSAWWVDAATSSVVLALDTRPRDARGSSFVDDARRIDPAVRVRDGQAPVLPHYDLVGGDAIITGGARCSIGFSARTLTGEPRMITAGHCTTKGGDVNGANNVRIGPIRSSVFDRDGDWGVVDVTPQWTPTSAVAAGGDATVKVTGTATAPVGSTICRSGSTTGWHCGKVTATDVTANYSSGPVTGLTMTSACSEPGDSGGPFVAGSSAVGLLSGGSGDCRTAGGSTLYQPIGEVLSREGLSLVTG